MRSAGEMNMRMLLPESGVSGSSLPVSGPAETSAAERCMRNGSHSGDHA